jgi:hypothetical protein
MAGMVNKKVDLKEEGDERQGIDEGISSGIR